MRYPKWKHDLVAFVLIGAVLTAGGLITEYWTEITGWQGQLDINLIHRTGGEHSE